MALSLLARRDHSSGSLLGRLMEKGVPRHLAERVIAQLTERGWVDDRRLARALAERHLERGSAVGRVLEMKLRQAGIPDDVVREAAGDLEGSPSPRDVARRLLERRYPGAADSGDPVLRRRAAAFLQRRGFSFSDISSVLGRGGYGDDDR